MELRRHWGPFPTSFNSGKASSRPATQREASVAETLSRNISTTARPRAVAKESSARYSSRAPQRGSFPRAYRALGRAAAARDTGIATILPQKKNTTISHKLS